MNAGSQQAIRIPQKTLQAIANDMEKSAKVLHLVYVNDQQAGITRKRRGNTFSYYQNKEKVTDKAVLQRIKSLVLPPAWENVWICRLENGHLQATGYDVRKRKQYRYHNLWSVLRNETKFFRLYEFGQVLPVIRKCVNRDLSLPGIPLEKVLAAVISIMELTSIRVGNAMYEKLYGSFGLTTLKDKHVNISGSEVKFIFKGKKGVQHTISLKSRKLANIIQKCRDIPGSDLFTFYDHHGNVHPVDSGMVNEYIKQVSGGEYSSKDFRTWLGTVQALTSFRELGGFGTLTEAKKKIVCMLDQVAKYLGNTRTVCRKYYVHPTVIRLYEENKLREFLESETVDEKILLKILEHDMKSTKVIPLPG